VPDDIPASALVGVVGCECGRPCRGPTSEVREEPAPVMRGADGVSLGAASVEVDAAPLLGDDTEGLLQDLVR
jgi:hypothetical protein